MCPTADYHKTWHVVQDLHEIPHLQTVQLTDEGIASQTTQAPAVSCCDFFSRLLRMFSHLPSLWHKRQVSELALVFIFFFSPCHPLSSISTLHLRMHYAYLFRTWKKTERAPKSLWSQRNHKPILLWQLMLQLPHLCAGNTAQWPVAFLQVVMGLHRYYKQHSSNKAASCSVPSF